MAENLVPSNVRLDRAKSLPLHVHTAQPTQDPNKNVVPMQYTTFHNTYDLHRHPAAQVVKMLSIILRQ